MQDGDEKRENEAEPEPLEKTCVFSSKGGAFSGVSGLHAAVVLWYDEDGDNDRTEEEAQCGFSIETGRKAPKESIR